ncbi:MAG: type II secretion system protein E, partial [Sulfobacillus thermosulfidooxidans]
MSLRNRINGMSAGASQAFKSIKTIQNNKPGDFDYLGSNFLALKSRVQDALLTQVMDPEKLSRDELRGLILNIVEADKDISPLEKDALVRILVDEILGYGPIQALLDDPDISEIMINGPSKIYIERHGSLIKTDVTFRDEAHLRSVLEKMLSFTGRRVDESSPMVDARLPDGSRLNAILRPLAVSGDSITIRKFSKDPFVLSQLVQMGTLSSEMAEFIQAAVHGKLNIVVSGGTGSGKTTTLNALSAFIPESERIVTIEDAAELQLQQDHKVTLEARPANIEGRGGITIRDL